MAYLDAEGAWVNTLDEAQVFTDSDLAEQRLADVRKAESKITEPYVFPAEMTDGRLNPLSAREKLRAVGPSTRLRRPDGSGAL